MIRACRSLSDPWTICTHNQANATLLAAAEREAAALQQTLEGLGAAMAGEEAGREEDEAAEGAAVAARGELLLYCIWMDKQVDGRPMYSLSHFSLRLTTDPPVFPPPPYTPDMACTNREAARQSLCTIEASVKEEEAAAGALLGEAEALEAAARADEAAMQEMRDAFMRLITGACARGAGWENGFGCLLSGGQFVGESEPSSQKQPHAPDDREEGKAHTALTTRAGERASTVCHCVSLCSVVTACFHTFLHFIRTVVNATPIWTHTDQHDSCTARRRRRARPPRG